MYLESVEQLVNEAKKLGQTLGGTALLLEAKDRDVPEEELIAIMQKRLLVMKEAISEGLTGKPSVGGLVGGQAVKYKKRLDEGKNLALGVFGKAITYALAVSEANASMGLIVAAPTAGSAGVLPGVLLSLMEEYSIPEEKVVEGLYAAGAVGVVIAHKASLSGAQGGCQAECGSAAAMAAVAAAELMGGTPEQAVHAGAIALKGMLGLVCDPVAGLVEVPCVKRNVAAAVQALAAADMALAGIVSAIPFDEVIDAMGEIGRALPVSLKETALGGLAATPTGKVISAKIYKQNLIGNKW
ncbi:L-serine ammonia-lyase, iron-sulfur-dependent, subunit alpha [Carboxydothermus hydrogenoformans]|uniref:L-serine dehydratase n=1 Tax=Carboxydothermus hydrogenoformans (strain ATCC BAA-161 / DSM 6008 / Z-2901) TaxID=246194 RepID=Q3A9D3_CARHZ|nr:L-serine ammonia-lyase, iron-sulfur-dependent, subunit alpha [Carboxydothermus hydrogenoformans]ABB14676.1 L-serine dehydratase, iron-sulfur-dependent, alpha subunit [Carboxydothermus hydrogenoformans Z-2901]